MNTEMYELYITKFVDNIISMNSDIKSSNITVNEQRIKILNYCKNLLSSISIIQYRTAIDQLTQIHLDSINSIEFDTQFQCKLKPDTDVNDSSDEEVTTDAAENLFDKMCKDNEHKVTFIKLAAAAQSIPDKYLPLKYTQNNIKTMILKAKEAAGKEAGKASSIFGGLSEHTTMKKKNSNKKPFDKYLEEYNGVDNHLVKKGNDLDDFIIFKNYVDAVDAVDDVEARCRCRIKLYSTKGRIYKKKVDAFTPSYYYKDKDGYYYGEQCTNKVDADSPVCCKLHSNLWLTGEFDLITMPPKHLEDNGGDGNIKKVIITPADISINEVDEYPPSSPLFTPPNSCPDSPHHSIVLSPISHVDSELDYDIKLEESDKVIKYNFEGHSCLLNKTTRELFDEKTFEYMGSLDDDVDLR
jgi:hypothetical protein